MADNEIDIWLYKETDSGRKLFRQICHAVEQDELDDLFNKHISDSAREQFVLDNYENTLISAQAAIKNLAIPDALKQRMLDGLNKLELDDEELEDEPHSDVGADEQSFLISNCAITLAESHMFFDAPYASLEYGYIDQQVETLMASLRDEFSSAIEKPAVSFASSFDLDLERLYQNDDFEESPIHYELGEVDSIWETSNGTWYLASYHEDKELPININLGRLSIKDYRNLEQHLNNFKV